MALLLGLVTCVACFYLRTVPVPSDPYDYVHAALEFPDSPWNRVGLTRYGVLLPLVLVTAFFGEGEASYYVTPLLATGVLAAAVYWIAARAFGVVAGVVSVVLLLANSVVLASTTRLYPDIFATSAAALAVAIALATRDRWRRDGRLSRGVLTMLVLAGLAVGLTWWMRETAIFAWPVIAAVLLWTGGPPRRAVVLVAGGAATLMLVVEMGLNWAVFGDPFERFVALSGADLSQTVNPQDVGYLGQARTDYLMVIPRGMVDYYQDGWWMLVLAGLAVIGGALAPKRGGSYAGWFGLGAPHQ